LQGALFQGKGKIQQWDFGAAPAVFSDAQLARVVDQLHRSFTIAPETAGFFSIEFDPLKSGAERVSALRGLGFNELTIPLGAPGQDGRIATLVECARGAGYRSVQIVLPGHLARHNAFVTARCLQEAMQLKPDRISLRGQELLALHVKLLADGGYCQAGVDMFTQSGCGHSLTNLVTSQRRFPQGDCRLAGPNLVGLGIGAVSALGSLCSQNTGTLMEYCSATERGKLPLACGGTLDRDQLLRRAVMQMLMCDFELSIAAVELVFAIDFASYFRREVEILQDMQEDELLILEDDWINIQGQARPLVRTICAAFALSADMAEAGV